MSDDATATEPAPEITLRDRIVAFKRIAGSRLVPHPENWRKHEDDQRSALNAVLSELGIGDALVVRPHPTKKGYHEILDGHLRRDEHPSVKWPCLVTDFTDDEARKFILTKDPLAGMATADEELLGELLGVIEDWKDAEPLQPLLDELHEVAGLIDEEEEAEPDDPAPDPSAALREKWSTELGQLWQLGQHRLLCGDATDPKVVARLMPDETAFIMVTDPPYGVDYKPGWRNEADVGDFLKGRALRSTGDVKNDDTASWLKAWQLFHGDVAYVWHSSLHATVVWLDLNHANLVTRAALIWRKPSAAISRGHYHWQHEPCLYAVRKGKTARWCGDRTQTTIWDIAGINPVGGTGKEEKTSHGTQKPRECMARPMRNHGAPGDIVYDPFVGSGTTIVAAENEGRLCRAIDLDPRYVAVTLERWVGLGGAEPKLLD